MKHKLQKRSFLNLNFSTITVLLILGLYTYCEKVLLHMNSGNKTFTTGHSFEIQTLYKINPISDQVYKRYLLYIRVSESLWLVTTLL